MGNSLGHYPYIIRSYVSETPSLDGPVDDDPGEVGFHKFGVDSIRIQLRVAGDGATHTMSCFGKWAQA